MMVTTSKALLESYIVGREDPHDVGVLDGDKKQGFAAKLQANKQGDVAAAAAEEEGHKDR